MHFGLEMVPIEMLSFLFIQASRLSEAFSLLDSDGKPSLSFSVHLKKNSLLFAFGVGVFLPMPLNDNAERVNVCLQPFNEKSPSFTYFYSSIF